MYGACSEEGEGNVIQWKMKEKQMYGCIIKMREKMDVEHCYSLDLSFVRTWRT